MDIITNLKKYNKRLSWDDYFISLTFLISNRSPCNRLNVGCILVKNNRVISSGYNGFIAGVEHKSVVLNNHEQMTVHAEMNAICDCARRGASCENATAYVTHFPCIICIKILISAGIKVIKYLDDYKNDELVIDLAKKTKTKLIKIKNELNINNINKYQ